MRQKTFDDFLKVFSDELLLSYFSLTLPTYIFTDTHETGRGAISCQLVASKSRCTYQVEKNYAQL